jgi:methyltransferase (TIGR00027 family)
MSNQEASHTAIGTAYLRAAHRLIDLPPHILEDNVAENILDKNILQRIINSPESFQTTERRELRSHVVLRSRYCEDRLLVSLQRGINQYLILGAGFDTFACRQPIWAKELKIIKIDKKETQKMKLSRIRHAGIKIPENVNYINIDFEKESLLDGLKRSSVSLEQRTFFSWLGVTMYLNKNAIEAVLRTVIQFPKDSEIVFTFAQPKGMLLSRFIKRVSDNGEPWKSYFTIGEIEKSLKEIGFSKVEFLSIKEAEEKYYKNRYNDLPLPKQVNIVSAIR